MGLVQYELHCPRAIGIAPIGIRPRINAKFVRPQVGRVATDEYGPCRAMGIRMPRRLVRIGAMVGPK